MAAQKKNMCIVGRRPGKYCAFCGSRLANQMCPRCDQDFHFATDDIRPGLHEHQLFDTERSTSDTIPVNLVHNGQNMLGSCNSVDQLNLNAPDSNVETGNSRRLQSVGTTTPKDVIVDDELERLRRDRQKIIDLLAKDYIPSKLEVNAFFSIEL